MKIGVFQDVHANLPAFNKAIEIFRAHNCSTIYHVGDLIGIGPHPKEVFEAAIGVEEMEFIMGNHDYWFAFGLPQPQPKWMSDEELEHQKWNHLQIGEKHRPIAQAWKFIVELPLSNNRKISFLHYGYDEKTNWFKQHIQYPTTEDLNKLFEGITSDFIFYGHNHLASDFSGHARFVNLGSAGCYHKPEVRLGILEVTDDQLTLEKLSVAYDDNGLMEDFERRKVPARAFITSNFITR